jgi:hypothetical protein
MSDKVTNVTAVFALRLNRRFHRYTVRRPKASAWQMSDVVARTVMLTLVYPCTFPIVVCMYIPHISYNVHVLLL